MIYLCEVDDLVKLSTIYIWFDFSTKSCIRFSLVLTFEDSVISFTVSSVNLFGHLVLSM